MPKPIPASSVSALRRGRCRNCLPNISITGTGSISPAFPYRGGALVIPDMLGGRIHVYWPTPATVLPLIREGKIKALAITGPQRNSDLPDVPTMRELGLDELTLEFWAGMWAPAGVPADVVEKLNAAVNEALQSSEMIASMKKLGFESRITSSRDFAAFVAAEIPRWTAVVKASGVKSQ